MSFLLVPHLLRYFSGSGEQLRQTNRQTLLIFVCRLSLFYVLKLNIITNEIVHKIVVQLHDDVETVTEFSYVGDRINSGGGCEAVVTSRTRTGWAKFREFHDLLY